ncbi:MAG TPA: hypothetical protein VGN17_23065 [Bryobacteraceae bacterium]|jgi:hypothetical protein
MKTYVREILKDLTEPKSSRDFIPDVPKAATEAPTVDLDAPEAPVMPDDLENQELSRDPAVRLQQLDQQAQDNERRETDS